MKFSFTYLVVLSFDTPQVQKLLPRLKGAPSWVIDYVADLIK